MSETNDRGRSARPFDARLLDPAGILDPTRIHRLYREAYLAALSEEIDRIVARCGGRSPPVDRGNGHLASAAPAPRLEPPAPAPSGNADDLETTLTRLPEESGRKKGSTLFDTAPPDDGETSGLQTTQPAPPPPLPPSPRPAPAPGPEIRRFVGTLFDTSAVGQEEGTGDGVPSDPMEVRGLFAAWWSHGAGSGDVPAGLEPLIEHVADHGLVYFAADPLHGVDRSVEIPFRALLLAAGVGRAHSRLKTDVHRLAESILELVRGLATDDDRRVGEIMVDLHDALENPPDPGALPSGRKKPTVNQAEVDWAFAVGRPELAKILVRFAVLQADHPAFVDPFRAQGVLLATGVQKGWDARSLRVFIAASGLLPVGTGVRLSDGCEAVVVGAGRDDPLRPRVRRLEDDATVDLAPAPGLSISRLSPRVG